MTRLAERSGRAAALAGERSLDALLVTDPINVRYLSGFSGTNGLCLVEAGARTLVTDFRYVERAAAEAPDYDTRRGRQELLGDVAELVKGRGGLRLGYEDAHLSVRRHAELAELLPGEVELVPAAGLVEELRTVKDEAELDAIGRAAALADELYRWLTTDHGLVGHSERDVALALERRAQDEGAERVAFPVIVAAAENGALPHPVARDVEIPRGTLVVVDLGCVVDGYCSDCTRTLATGTLDGEALEVYELVRSAQEAAEVAVRVGAEVGLVDAAAREPIGKAGHGEQFGHGTGHGVGLEVHEGPRIAPGSKDRLEVGNVVTVEPGVYVPGRFGVRIENLVAVEKQGSRLLTHAPRELVTV